jgi:hypothetical protein
MKFLKPAALVFVLFFCFKSLKAQAVLDGIAKTGDPFEGYVYNEYNKLDGYYNIYLREKVNSKKNLISVYLYDLNTDLYSTSSFEVPHNANIYEIAKTGKYIGIVYHSYNPYSEVSLLVFDYTTGEVISDKVCGYYFSPVKYSYKTAWGAVFHQSHREENKYIHSFPGGKFLVNYYFGGFNYQYFDVETNAFVPGKLKKVYQFPTLLYNDNQYAYFKIDHARKSKRLSGTDIVVMDIKSGEVIKEVKHTDFDKSVIVKSILPQKNNKLLIAGVYNNTPGLKKVYRKPTNGVVMVESDSLLKITSQQYIPWNEVSNSGVNISENGKIDKSFLFVHDFIRDTADNIYMTAESVNFRLNGIRFFPLPATVMMVPFYNIIMNDVYVFKYDTKFVHTEHIDLEESKYMMPNIYSSANRHYYMQIYSYSHLFKFTHSNLDTLRNRVYINYIQNNYSSNTGITYDRYNTAIINNKFATSHFTTNNNKISWAYRNAPGKIFIKQKVNNDYKKMVENL